MAGNQLIPISDEQAKLGQELVGAGRDFGGYLAGILADLPKDLIGLLIGDKVKVRRAQRLAELWESAQEHLHRQGIIEPESPGLKLSLPILAGAADENRKDLKDLWARLFAASMHPDQSKLVRLRFIDALQKLDPLDARVMMWMGQNGGDIDQGRQNSLATEFGVARDEIEVSLRNLVKVEFATEGGAHNIFLLPFGREFLRCVSD